MGWVGVGGEGVGCAGVGYQPRSSSRGTGACLDNITWRAEGGGGGGCLPGRYSDGT